jgi:hypothetical protein
VLQPCLVACRRTQERLDGKVAALDAAAAALRAAVADDDGAVAALKARAADGGGARVLFSHDVSLEELTAKARSSLARSALRAMQQ